jgi:hypothetical protein
MVLMAGGRTKYSGGVGCTDPIVSQSATIAPLQMVQISLNSYLESMTEWWTDCATANLVCVMVDV